jgi:hypothetical protein
LNGGLDSFHFRESRKKMVENFNLLCAMGGGWWVEARKAVESEIRRK